MGIIVTIIPNVSDYWIQILNPSQEIYNVLADYESEIIQEVKILTEERWINIKVASVLLKKILEEHKIVNSMFEETKRKVFVPRCGKQETLDPDLYDFFFNKCEEKHEMSPQNEGETQIFMFQKPGTIINVRTAFSQLQTKELDKLPAQYLLLQLKNTYQISLFKEGKASLLCESPLNQKMVISLIKEAIVRDLPDEINYTTESVLNEIFEQGNCQKADLLVEDIFGPDNCHTIGLPPKLIASSLAKFAKEQKVTSSVWDQTQSLLVAFAINIGILVKEQIYLTKVKTVVLKTNQISSRQFLNVISTILAPYGQVIFLKHDIPAICANKIFKTKK